MRTVKSNTDRYQQVWSIVPASIARGLGAFAVCATTTDHRLKTGQWVSISGVTPSSLDSEGLFNGKFQVTVIGARIFSYLMLARPGTDATITASARVTPILEVTEYEPFTLVDPTTGRLLVSVGGGKQTAATATGLDQLVIKSEPGQLFSLEIFNSDAAIDLYALLFDKATAAINGDLPVGRMKIAANNQNYFGQYVGGRIHSVGIVAAMSTTFASLTLPATNKGFFDANYQ